MIKNLIKKFALLGAFVSLTVSSAWAADTEDIPLMASETVEITTGTAVARKWTVVKDDTAAERLDVKVERLVDSTAKVTISANGTTAAEKTAVIALYGDGDPVKTINVTITAKEDKNYVGDLAKSIMIGETWSYTTVATGDNWSIAPDPDNYKSYDLSKMDGYFTNNGSGTSGTSRSLTRNDDGTVTLSITGVAPNGSKTLIIDLKRGNEVVQKFQVWVVEAVEDVKILKGETVRKTGSYNKTDGTRRWVTDRAFNNASSQGTVGLSLKNGNNEFGQQNFQFTSTYPDYKYNTTSWNTSFNADLKGNEIGYDFVLVGRYETGSGVTSFSPCYRYNVFVYENKTTNITMTAGETFDLVCESGVKGAWEVEGLEENDETVTLSDYAGWTETSFATTITANKEAKDKTFTVKNNFCVYTVVVNIDKGTGYTIKNIPVAAGDAYNDTIEGGASASSDATGVATVELDKVSQQVTILGVAAGDAVCIVKDGAGMTNYLYNVTVYSNETRSAFVGLDKEADFDCRSAFAGEWTAQLAEGASDGIVQIKNEWGVSSTEFTLQLKGLKIGDTTLLVKNKYAQYTFNVRVADNKSIGVPKAVTGLTYTGAARTGVPAGTGYKLTGNVATDAGDYTATATLEEGYIWSDGSTDPADIAWSIGYAKATVAAVDTNKVYGAAQLEFTATVTGTFGDDEIDYTVGLTNEAVKVGTYDIVPTGVITQGNYTVAYVTAKYAILKATPAVTAWPGATDIYIGNTLGDSELTNGVADVDGAFVWADPGIVPTNGMHYAVIFRPEDGDDYNELTNMVTVTVLQRVAVPTGRALTYNGQVQTGVVERTGYTLTGHTGTDVDDYTATATLAQDYRWADGTTHPTNIAWSIGYAKATVTAVSANKLVGTSDPKFTATVTGTFGDDEIAYAVGRTNTAQAVGTYADVIVPTGDITQNNYTVTYVAGDFEIRTGAMTVNGKGYDDLGEALADFGRNGGTAVLHGDLGGRKITLPENGTVQSAKRLSATDDFTEPGRYSRIAEAKPADVWEYTLATLTPVEVPRAVAGLTYTGLAQTGVVEDVGFTLTGNVATNVGAYTAWATLADGYCWTDDTTHKTNIAWSIDRAKATVTAVSTNKLYGAEEPKYTTTVEGFYDGDDVTLTWKVWRTNACEDVGTYDLIVSGDVHQASYEITYYPGKFEILAGRMTVTTNGVTRGYDDFDAALAAMTAARGGKALFNEDVTVGGSTFASGSTLTVNADGSWSTDGTLTLADDIYVPSRVTATNLLLGADIKVGVWTGETATAEQAILVFRNLDRQNHRMTLTTNGVVRSLNATKLVDTNDFTSVTNVFDVPPAHEIVEKAIAGGYEYTLRMVGYVLTFDSKGGSKVDPIVAAAGATVYGPEENPTKTGHAFADWTTNGVPVSFPLTMPAENFTLYANWTPNAYRVAYDPNGGAGLAVTNGATYGAAFEVRENPGFEKTGYSFGGWTTNLSSAVRFQPGDSVSNLTAEADATATMYAVWAPNEYKVVYNPNGGSGKPAESNATYDVEFKVSGNPGFAKTGYTFESWTNAAGDVFAIGASATNLTTSGAVTLYAAWTPNGYTLTYKAGEGTGDDIVSSMVYDVAYEVADCTFAKTGYSFANWTNAAGTAYQPGETVSNLTAEKGGNVNFTAVWAANVYTVTFDPANGEDPFPFATNCDATVWAPAQPTRTGYAFKCWSTNGVEVIFPIKMPAGGLEVTALWNANEYRVKYDPNGGSGVPAESNATYDVEFEVAGQPFTKTGYTFESWTNAAGDVFAIGDRAKNLTAEPDEEVTLYAKWTPITYWLVYTANGGAGEDVELELTYDVPHTVIDNPFKRPRYGFAGWIDGEGASVTNQPGSSVKNLANKQDAVVTWLAAWTEGRFTLTFDSNGGSAVDPISRKSGEAISAPADPTRDWYEFAGWTTNGAEVASFPTTMPGEDLTFVAQWTAAPGNPENPWSLGPDGSDAVEAYFDPDLERVVIRLNETNEIDLAALTNALVQATKAEIDPDRFNAVVEIDEGAYMTPESWSDTRDGKDPYPTLGDALKGATRFVCPNLSEEEPPAEIVEKGKTETGDTVTATVENDHGEVPNAIQAIRVVGLLDIAEREKKDVALTVRAKMKGEIGEDSVLAFDFVNTNGIGGVIGWETSYVDLSVHYGGSTAPEKSLGSLVEIHIPWAIDRQQYRYRASRIHDGVAEAIPEYPRTNGNGEYFKINQAAGEVVFCVSEFSYYSIATIETPELEADTFITVDEEVVEEGSSIVIRVTGGSRALSTSVQLQAVYGTASASDLDLKSAKVNGALVSGFKFPYALTWENGDFREQVVEIPVKVQSKDRQDRDLTFALANPMNAQLEGVDDLDANMSYRRVTILCGLGPVKDKVFVRATPNDATRGKTSGSALVVPGKKVTVRATANKGYVFTGWFEGEELQERAASYAFTPVADVSLVARFEPLAADFLELKDDFLPAEIEFGEVFSNAVTVASGSLPTVSVSGLPAGLKYYAKETVVKATSKALGYTVPANTIYGIPTKASATNRTSGVVTPSKVKVTVKNLGGYKIVRTYELRVTARTTGLAKVVADDRPYAAVSVALSDDAAGKVTGAGLYQAGKKVTLKATANKGYVFAEWLENGVNVSSNASYVINPMPSDDVSLVAKFVLPGEIPDPSGKDAHGVAVVRNNDFAGSVTGAGYYQAGKKVTLKATALKGYVFAGWATDDFTVTNQAASLTFTMGTEKVRAYAVFVTAGEDLASIEAAANGTKLFVTPKGVACLATNVMCGVTLRWPVVSTALSLPTVKVSGLPSGLKFTAKDIVDSKTKLVTVPANTIYGAPTSASKTGKPSAVKVTVTTSGKSKAEYQIALTVDPLPDYAVGTFDGPYVANGVTNGVVKLTVAANGKISGTIQTNLANAAAKKLTLKATSFASYGLVTGVFTLVPTYKDGKATVEVPLTLADSGAVVRERPVGVINGDDLFAYRNVLKGATADDFVAPDLSEAYPELDVTVKKDGVLGVAGKVDGVSASGSSQIYYDANEAGYRAVIFLPSKKGFDGVAEIVAVPEE